MKARLNAYLALERIMFELAVAGDELGEAIRVMMNPVWYSLSDAVRRTVPLEEGSEGDPAAGPEAEVASSRDFAEESRWLHARLSSAPPRG